MLEDLKLRVMNTAKKAQRDGLCKHKSGNFSARDAETGYVVITPTSVDREDLVVPDMIVMDLDANVIENQTGLRPTSESLMHLEIYKTRPDVMAVAHTHSMYATVFAVLNKPVPAVVYEIANLKCSKARIPVAPYGRPGTPALAESVVEPCKEADVFLLQGHGAVAVDETNIEEAYLKAAYIEELSELYHHALTANGCQEPDSFPVEELQSWEYPKEIKFPNA
ncbi:MAG: class II aldolase/adducin family protein [Parolsenella sp.]|uniref:class II aldolase/adducin family protein n=1 Tax=Parolsenella sp. TaxID=2083006 RepID=UPI002A766CCB|nr:class II aldolase/adducin family protein [Parolsenella sp.]MDY3291517.1 class II aldolase/adducin family protein [Parolsenella sp.]